MVSNRGISHVKLPQTVFTDLKFKNFLQTKGGGIAEQEENFRVKEIKPNDKIYINNC